jgi:hypothetical protein
MADGGKIRHNDSVLPRPTIKTRECTTLQERTVIGQHNEGKEMPVGKGDVIVIVIVITNQDSTSSRLLPGSSYSCCIRNLHALVHKQCHPVHITTAHEIHVLSHSNPLPL